MRGATDFGPRGGEATAIAALGGRLQLRPRAESDSNHTRCRGARSFVDDLVQSRGVVLSRAVHFCDLLRPSPTTRRFVRFGRTRLLSSSASDFAVFLFGRRAVRVERWDFVDFPSFALCGCACWTLPFFQLSHCAGRTMGLCRFFIVRTVRVRRLDFAVFSERWDESPVVFFYQKFSRWRTMGLCPVVFFIKNFHTVRVRFFAIISETQRATETRFTPLDAARLGLDAVKK